MPAVTPPNNIKIINFNNNQRCFNESKSWRETQQDWYGSIFLYYTSRPSLFQADGSVVVRKIRFNLWKADRSELNSFFFVANKFYGFFGERWKYKNLLNKLHSRALLPSNFVYFPTHNFHNFQFTVSIFWQSLLWCWRGMHKRIVTTTTRRSVVEVVIHCDDTYICIICVNIHPRRSFHTQRCWIAV